MDKKNIIKTALDSVAGAGVGFVTTTAITRCILPKVMPWPAKILSMIGAGVIGAAATNTLHSMHDDTVEVIEKTVELRKQSKKAEEAYNKYNATLEKMAKENEVSTEEIENKMVEKLAEE